MPKTCCSVAPSVGVTRRATSGISLAPPTWMSFRLERSGVAVAAASSHSSSSGGTRAVSVTFSAAISSKHTAGVGAGASTTRPPT